MKCTEIQELAAAHAVGALSRADIARLEALMAADPDVAAEVAAYRNALTSAIDAGPDAAAGPSPALRGRIWERISRTPQSRPAEPTPASSPGHVVIPHDSDTWIHSRVPGFRFKPLSVQPHQGYRMRLLELAPGGRIPAHDHADSEELFIVSGDLVSEGHHLVAGDFVHFDGNTHHHELMSPGGCHAILVERTPLPAATFQAAVPAP